MRFSRSLALLQLSLLLGIASTASAAPGVTEAAPRAAEPAPQGFFARYAAYVDRKIEELQTLPLWGMSASLPEGVLKLRYDLNPASADHYFDETGTKVTLLPPIEFLDFGGTPGRTLIIDPRVTGKGVGHTFQVGYGVTDVFNAFVEFPFTKVRSDLELNGTLDGAPINSATRGIVIDNIESNGRPRPGTKFRGGMDLGNVMMGVSWNYFRNDWYSTQVVPRVFLPTGQAADPNNDLTFLLGPEIDRGIPAWTLNLTHVIDVRPVDFLVFNLEVQASYRLGYDRDAPKWLPLTDCKRVQDPVRRTNIGCTAGTPYDPAYDREQGVIFPDLTELDATFHMDPTLSEEMTTGFTIEPGVPIPIQVAYNYKREQTPKVRASGPNGAGERFERLTEQLALFTGSELHSIGAGIQLPLFPLYVPIAVTLSGRWPIAGKNSIVLKDNYSIAFEMFLPIGDLWMEPRAKPAAAH